MVLSLLSRHPDASFTLSEICQRLDLNVSTAHSLLNALTAAQFLVRHPGTKRYSLGPELVRIGAAAASRQVTLTEHARERMGRLAEATGRQCVASTVVGDDMVIIAKAGNAGPSGVTMDIGARMPLRPPFGTVFVAWSGEASIRAWLDETIPYSGPLMDQCLNALSAVRSQGYSVGMSISDELSEQIWRPSTVSWATTDKHSRQAFEQLILNEYLVAELHPDREYAIGNISAPVFGADGRVVLALAIPYFSETLPGSLIAEHARLLVQAAGAGDQGDPRRGGAWGACVMTAEPVSAFLRGCAFAPHADAPYPRANLDDRRLPADIAAAARVPAGVSLAVTGPAEAIELSYTAAAPADGLRGTSYGTAFAAYPAGRDRPSAEAAGSSRRGHGAAAGRARPDDRVPARGHGAHGDRHRRPGRGDSAPPAAASLAGLRRLHYRGVGRERARPDLAGDGRPPPRPRGGQLRLRRVRPGRAGRRGGDGRRPRPTSSRSPSAPTAGA